MAGPGGIESGRAAVIVLPDLTKFAPALKKYLERAEKTLRLNVATKADTTGLDEDLARKRQTQQKDPIDVPVTAKTDEFSRQARAAVAKAARDVEGNIPITPDGEEFRRKLAAQIAGLEKLLSVEVPVSAEGATAFRQQVLAHVEQVQAMTRDLPVEVPLEPETTGFIAKLRAYIKMAEANAPPVRIKTEVDKSQTAAAEQLGGTLSRLVSSAASFATVILAWGPPLIAAAAAVVAMAPALALLLPLAGGLAIGVGAVALGFDALSKKFAPLVKAVGALQKPIGAVLTKGLGPLVDKMVTGFVPVLKDGLTTFARLGNVALTQLLKFTTSSAGLKSIGQLFSGIGTAMAPLAKTIAPLARIFIGLGVAATPALTLLNKAILGITQRFAAFVDAGVKSGSLTKSISNAASATGRFLGSLGDFLGPLAKGLAAIGPSVLSGLSSAFTALGNGITWIIQTAQQLQPTFQQIGTAISPFLGIFRELGKAIGANFTSLATQVGSAAGAFKPFLAVAQAVATSVSANIGPAFAFIRSLLGPLITGIQGFATAVGPQLMPTFEALKGFVAGLMPTLQAFAQQFVGVLGPGIASIGQVIATDLLPAIQAILPVITPVVAFILKTLGGAIVGALSGAIQVIKGALKIISGIFNVIAGVFTGDWTRAWNGIKQIFSGAFTAILGLVKVVWNLGILKAFKLGVSGIFAAIKGLGKGLLSLGRGALGLLKTAFTEGVPLAIKVVKDIPGKALAALGNLGKTLYSAGVDLIQGLLNGAKSLLKTIGSFFLNQLPGWIQGPFKKAMGIASPSKVMIQLGRYIGDGLVVGLLGSSSQVTDASKTLANKITDAVTSYADKAGALSSKIAKDAKAVAEAQALLKRAIDEHAKGASTSIKNASDRLADAEAKYAADRRKGGTATTLAADRKDIERAQRSYDTAVAGQAKSAEHAISAAKTRLQKALEQLSADQAAKQALALSYAGIATASPQQIAATLTLIDTVNKRLSKIADARTKVAEQLKDAQTALDNAIKLRSDYAKSVADATRAYASILTDPAEGKALTANDVVKQLQEKLAAIVRFRANIEALKASGLNDTALQQLVDAGVDAGSQTAAALASGGQAAIDQINLLTKGINNEADTLGTKTAGYFFDAGVDAAQGLVDGLTSKQAALDAAAKRIADTLVSTVKGRLGIKSPSTVLHNLGAYSGEGFANGLDASRSLIEAATNRLSAAALPTVPNVGGGGLGEYAARGGITVNTYNPAPETPSETVTKSMRKLAVLGTAA